MNLTEEITGAIEAPGATVTYDVHAGDSPDATPLFLIGSPMAAPGFVTLASYFTDRTVITYDPRGSERSQLTEPTRPPTPEQHADDLHQIIEEIGAGPVDMFASSGGAVNALALVARHPEDVGRLVAHEPPLPRILPDREAALAAARAVHETYMRSGWGAGMGHFIAVVSHQGEFPEDFAQQPPPDPQMFGMPADDDGSRTDPLLGLALVGSVGYEPDFEALRATSTRIVMAAGNEEGTIANRGAYGVADRLGTTVVVFPSGHGGFLGGEYGQMGQPDAFAAKLRSVLAES
ncbi:MAG TPA: alpha/beta hydrolase [Acidimicrobiia bacterium]|nr:alpha/beta hydrolase [Acidimicrobiia bacterium]